jgi:hypothetical protein
MRAAGDEELPNAGGLRRAGWGKAAAHLRASLRGEARRAAAFMMPGARSGGGWMNARDGPGRTITRRFAKPQLRRRCLPIPAGTRPGRRSPAAARRAQLARSQVRHRRRPLAVDLDERLRPGEARLGPVIGAAVAARHAFDPRPDLAGGGWPPARHSGRIPRGGGGLRQVLRGADGRGGFGPSGRRHGPEPPSAAPRITGDGGGGIRTLGTPNDAQRFSRPPHSTTLPPLRGDRESLLG